MHKNVVFCIGSQHSTFSYQGAQLGREDEGREEEASDQTTQGLSMEEEKVGASRQGTAMLGDSCDE